MPETTGKAMSLAGRRAVFGATVVAWLGVCGILLWNLMRRAAEAPPGAIEEYARAPGMQVLTFVLVYLPVLVLVLAVVLRVEVAVLKAIDQRRSESDGT